MAGPQPVTFIYMHDPQPQVGNDSTSDPYGRVARLGQVNACLNTLNTTNWPTDSRLASNVSGTQIGNTSFVVFGGDMCQTGGAFNLVEYSWPGANAINYIGGPELQDNTWLFNPRWDGKFEPPDAKDYSNSATRISQMRVLFGLGNHDVWDKDSLGPPWESKGPHGGWKDYYRYQMWNFIAQMHAGVSENGTKSDTKHVNPQIPVNLIDSDGYSFEWKKFSFNYRVDMGLFTILQLHRYPGDNGYGRADGLDWLKTQLQSLGTGHPIIIVHHYPYDNLPSQQDPSDGLWSQSMADSFLQMVKGYNIIAFLTGHVHMPPLPLSEARFTDSSGTIVFDQIRPGICSMSGDPADQGGRFSVIRVSDTDVNVAHGMAPTSNNASINWYDAWSKDISHGDT